MEGKNETQRKIEIRTMTKDIARLREKATDKQREKIVAIKAEPASQSFDNAKNLNMGSRLSQMYFGKQEQIGTEKETLSEKKENLSGKEINLENQREQTKTRLAELLNKAKGSINSIKERTELRKTEKELSEQQLDMEGKFFKKSFEKEEVAIPAEIQQTEKTPEQIMIERFQAIEKQREKEGKEREDFLQRVTEEKIQVQPESIQIMSSVDRYPLMSKNSLKKIPISEKIWVRILVLGVIIAWLATIFTYWYWANVARKPIVTQVPVVTTTPQQMPVYSQSFVPVKETIFLKFNTAAELKNTLSQYLKNPYSEGETRRIVFGDNQTKQILTIQQLFMGLGINAPPALSQKVNKDFTLFIYSKEAYNRFGIIMKIDNRENLPALLTGWEPSMEQDLGGLFLMIGKQNPAIVPYFRSGKYSGYSYRFQTFSTNDLGICYSTMGDYFVLTSSMESLNRVIDQLK